MVYLSEKAAELLKSKLEKALSEKQGAYILLVGSYSGVKVVVCLSSVYAKIILEKDLSMLSCREAEYNPHGLYAFSSKPEELAEKVLEKIVLLARRTAEAS